MIADIDKFYWHYMKSAILTVSKKSVRNRVSNISDTDYVTVLNWVNEQDPDDGDYLSFEFVCKWFNLNPVRIRKYFMDLKRGKIDRPFTRLPSNYK